MCFSHFHADRVWVRDDRKSSTSSFHINLQTEGVSTSYSSLFRSHRRLMIAVSYNLWISADHRCWLVGWEAFLIKKQMSGGAKVTLWHHKGLLWYLYDQRDKRRSYTWPRLLSGIGGAIVTLLSALGSYICMRCWILRSDGKQRLVWVWKLQHQDGSSCRRQQLRNKHFSPDQNLEWCNIQTGVKMFLLSIKPAQVLFKNVTNVQVKMFISTIYHSANVTARDWLKWEWNLRQESAD